MLPSGENSIQEIEDYINEELSCIEINMKYLSGSPFVFPRQTAVPSMTS